MNGTARYELMVLGPVSLQRSDGISVRSVLAQPRRVALLTYLLLARPGDFVSRDTLMAVFWPEADEGRARNALRQAIHFLRRSLGAHAIEARGDYAVRVSPAAVACDVLQFDEHLDHERFDAALLLVRGAFLEGVPLAGMPKVEDWAAAMQRCCHEKALRAALALHAEALAAGRHASAVDWARRAVALDPLSADAAAGLIDALGAAGDVVDAVRSFDDYRDHLRDALDLPPPDRVVAAAARWRTGKASPPEPEPRAREPTPNPVEQPVAIPRTDAAGRPRTRRRRARLSAIVLTALLLGSAPSAARLGAVPRAESRSATAVAVLPFVSRGDDPDDGLAHGVQESLIYLLSRTPSIVVTARAAVDRFTGSREPLHAIAEELSVDALIAGSVQHAGDAVRISIELIDPRSGTQRWSAVYDRTLDDILAVQSDIAVAVARAATQALTSHH